MTLKNCLLVAPFLAWAALASPPPDTISTYAGGGPNNLPATQSNISFPVNTAVDSKGNFYAVNAAAISEHQRLHLD